MRVETYNYIDRFFQSSRELTDSSKSEERDINTLFSFLDNLHSFQDRIKKDFQSSIADYPEFKLLRILRNYYHHVGDLNESSVFVIPDNRFEISHVKLIIIPTSIIAKAILSFKENNKKIKNLLIMKSKIYQDLLMNFILLQKRLIFFQKIRF